MLQRNIFCFLLLHFSYGNDDLRRNCTKGWVGLVGDGNCDAINNNGDCQYDGGDCCECTCVDGADYSCGYSGFVCLDGNATACPGELGEQYPDCEGDLAFLGDGSCDYENNNESCGYDDGDCCECTCSDGWYYTCDDNTRFNCMDPDAPCYDANAVPVYPNCTEGSIGAIGDSICDDDNNNEACGYDEGDCCECTCTDGQYAFCGLFVFNCLDPDSPKEIYNCEETPSTVPPCPAGGQRDWVVENTSQAQLLSDAVYCSGGMFSVEWKSSVTINTTIFVLNGTVLNVTGHSTNASIDGGGIKRIFTVVNASLHVTDMVIRGGSANSGGAVAASGSNLTFNRTAFVNNTTPNSGGALYITGGSTVVFHEDTTFSNNSADGRGGGIYLSDGGYVSFTGKVTFANNHGSRGGALYSSGGATIWWEGAANFSENTATMRGGAVCMDDSSIASWAGETTFSGNSAASGGGVFVNEASSVSWVGLTTFSGNRATISLGGAIRVTGGSKAVWSASLIFAGNTADEEGGGLAVTTGSSASWSGDTWFLANTAFDSGGGFTAGGGSSIEWNSTTRFDGNYGEESGGAAFMTTNSSVTWSGDTVFSNNTANTGSGGAIIITTESKMEWLGLTMFRSNTAGSNGGAVASYPYDSNTYEYEGVSEADSTLNINAPTTFADNSCGGNGGGLALPGALAISFGTTDVIFSRNSAQVSGGAVFISSTATGPVFKDMKFELNYAQMGGAVYATGSGTALAQDVSYATRFLGCTFTGNTASSTGGAIESAAGVDIIRDSYFYRNSAEVGGALRLAGTATLDNCSFIENVSGEDRGPAMSNIGFISEIEDCYFRGNLFHCDSGEFLEFNDDGDIDETVCDDGCTKCSSCFFAESRLVPTCTVTMANTETEGGTKTIEDVVVNAGFWRATNTSKSILPCYNPDACPKGATSGLCYPGYEGPYCSICSKNYTNGLQYTCTECYDRSSGIALITLLVAFGMAIAISIFFHLVSGGKEGTGPGIVNRLRRNIPLQSLKITIVAWQILTQFASVANVAYPDIYRHLLDTLDVLNFDLSWAFSLGCFVDVDFHDRMLIVTIGPIAAICLLGITYAIGVWRNRQSEDALRNIRHKHVSMVLLVTFLVYSSVSSVLFQMFDCDHLDDGKHYLQADYSIECSSSKHQNLQVYAAVMIALFPIGIPTFYTYLLFRSHSILIDRDRRENDVTVEPISDLWNPFKPSRFYYEVIECIRRITLTCVVLLIDDDTAAQIAAVLMIAYIFAVLFEVLAPYETQLDTWVSRTGHAVVFSSMYVALLLKVEVSSESSTSQQVFEVILVVSHACMVLAVVFEAVIVTFSLRPTTQQEPRRRSFARDCHWKRMLFPFNRGVPPVETFDLELTVRPSRSARLY